MHTQVGVPAMQAGTDAYRKSCARLYNSLAIQDVTLLGAHNALIGDRSSRKTYPKNKKGKQSQ